MRGGDIARSVIAAAGVALVAAAVAACGDDASAGLTVTVTDAAAPAAPAASTAPLVERPPDFPTTGERFLLRRVAPDVARRCTREADGDRSEGSIAGIVCQTQAVYGVESYFELFRNRVATEAAYGSARDAAGVPVARGQCVPPGGGGRAPGDATWGFGADAPSQGRVMCFREGDEVWFVTSVEAINVIAFARAPRFGALDRFWRTVGIPSVEPIG